MVHLIPVRSGAPFSGRVCANIRQSNQDVTVRNAVLSAWSAAISTIWIVFTPLSGFSLILTLFLREYTLDRKIVRADEAKTSGDLERGLVANNEGDLQGPKSLHDGPEMTPTSSGSYSEEEPATDKEKMEA